MKRKVILIPLLLLANFFVKAQDSIVSRIVLIGDAGQLTNGRQPVIDAVKQKIKLDKNTTIVFLGDNLYKSGLPDDAMPTYALAKAPLDSQIQIASKTDAKVYFIPGNHDWANGSDIGFESILRVQSYIDLLGDKNVKMLPRDGCPGPEEVEISDKVSMVIVDSQWWIHEEDKPGIESDCPYKTKTEVLNELDEILSKNSEKLVILAMHHPFKSYGPHGGYFTLKQHIFPFTDVNPNLYIPLPVLGSVYPLTRAVFGTAQDLKHPFYQEMIRDFTAVFQSHPNVIMASGHEHTLQLIKDSSFNYIVSGSASKSNRVSKGKNSEYASSANGFATLEISKNKNVRASFYILDGDSVKQDFTKNILNFTSIEKEEEKVDTLRKVEYAYKDTVVISASDQYKNYSGFKKTFLGKNYRDLWSTPVKLKVFNINKEQGGFKIISLGGGKQTKSLKLEDKNGKEWSLRTIDKDPEKALPANLRGTLAQDIVQDMISASHPYAPLVVPTLAKATGVLSMQPKFFFVPDDPSFGPYQKIFANNVVMLVDKEPTPDGSNAISTNKVLNKMYEDNDHRVDQPLVLKARLLDMLIADFDRHADQWRWGVADTGKGKLYYPVPRDRDQAFFNSDGLLVDFLSQENMRFLQGFKNTIPDINGLNFVARDFDRYFLNKLTRQDWENALDTFKMNLTDEVIRKAVSMQPDEIVAIDSARLVQTLIGRRDAMKKAGLKYFKFISKDVTILGSNEQEYFHVENSDGNLQLSVFKRNEESDSLSLMYRRIFSGNETKELRLYGLNGPDKFEIDPDVNSKIKLRIIGGKGTDTFDLKGNVKSYVYDLKQEENSYLNLRRTSKNISTNPSVLNYKNVGYEYNKFSFPQVNAGFNAEDGILIGLGLTSITHGFRKEPYSTKQKVTTLFAPFKEAYQLKYNGIFNQVIKKNDLVVNAEFVNPTLDNFYGFGNQTVYDKTKGKEFYLVRYKYVSADLLIRKRIKNIIEFSAGPSYYQYWNNYADNRNKILANPVNIGSDSNTIYSNKSYLGAKINLDVNYLNSELFPTRGITWYNKLVALDGINKNSKELIKLTSDMTIYAALSQESKVNTVFRFGGGHIFTKNPEYFQTLNLGANNYLRGFRKNRFSGTSSAYANTEVRVKLFKSKSYLLPGDVGILGFYDIGRVWLKGADSNKWHQSYGAGLYFVPFNLAMVSASVGFSEEDQLFNFSVGTKFNLTF